MVASHGLDLGGYCCIVTARSPEVIPGNRAFHQKVNNERIRIMMINQGGNEWFTGGNEWFVGGNEWFVGGNEWFVPTGGPGNEWFTGGNEW
jgi:hypothetical protein